MSGQGQYPNRTAQEARREVEFVIPAGERESNSVNCESKSLISALLLQNLDSNSVEVKGSNDNAAFYPITKSDHTRLNLQTLITPWEIENGYIPGYLNVEGFENQPNGIYITPDGTKLFIIGKQKDSVQAFLLTTPNDITTAVFESSLNISAMENNPENLYFKPDGSKLFIVGSSNSSIYSFSLAKEWDLSEAKFIKSFSVADQEVDPSGIFINDDGNKLFIVGRDSDEIHAYDLLTAWDLNYVEYVNGYDLSGEDTFPYSLAFKSDGSKFFVIGNSTKKVYSYSLVEAWDISTSSPEDSYELPNVETQPFGLFINRTGNKLFIAGGVKKSIYEFVLENAWALADVVVKSTLDISGIDSAPSGIYFKPDGTRLYMIGAENDKIFSFSLSMPFNITTAEILAELDISVQSAVPQGLSISNDGTHLLVVDSLNRDVYSYALSDPWDITSATYVATLDVSGETGAPTGLFINNDGTIIFISDGTNNAIYRYDLSTAFDLSTATYLNSLVVTDYQEQPTDLFFDFEGIRMFVVGQQESAVALFELEQAWNITTASFKEEINTDNQDPSPNGVSFSPTGDLFYLVGGNSAYIYQFRLKKSTWVTVKDSETVGYQYLKIKSDQQESEERTIKAILK